MDEARHKVESESRQRGHFDNIIAEYETHYDDPSSQKYRQNFMLDPLLKNIELNGTMVLEAMCGSGQATGYLLSKGAHVHGLDVSEVAVRRFRERWTSCEAICSSIVNAPIPDNAYDCVIIVSGLHHLHPFVDDAVHTVYRVLKSGGYFCFVEPHTGAILNTVRERWYKRDHYFEENEAAIDLEDLKRKNGGRFRYVGESYGGNIGYFLILQSLILRIPARIKRMYAAPVLWLEKLFTPLQASSKAGSSFVICRWQKI